MVCKERPVYLSARQNTTANLSDYFYTHLCVNEEKSFTFLCMAACVHELSGLPAGLLYSFSSLHL